MAHLNFSIPVGMEAEENTRLSTSQILFLLFRRFLQFTTNTPEVTQGKNPMGSRYCPIPRLYLSAIYLNFTQPQANLTAFKINIEFKKNYFCTFYQAEDW